MRSPEACPSDSSYSVRSTGLSLERVYARGHALVPNPVFVIRICPVSLNQSSRVSNGRVGQPGL